MWNRVFLHRIAATKSLGRCLQSQSQAFIAFLILPQLWAKTSCTCQGSSRQSEKEMEERQQSRSKWLEDSLGTKRKSAGRIAGRSALSNLAPFLRSCERGRMFGQSHVNLTILSLSLTVSVT